MSTGLPAGAEAGGPGRATAWPLHHESRGPVAALPEALFDHLDDPHRLSSHMERSSAAMLGTRMALACDAQGGRAVGSVIRMEGQVLGVPLRLLETITERRRPWLKAWETVGEPRLLVIGRYRMGFRIEPAAGQSLLSVFIDYRLPAARGAHLLGTLLGPAYARWCCRRMVRDAQEAFRRPA